MAPGLRHLAGGRPHARAARDEHRDLSQRGERVQRPADVHPGQPQARRGRRSPRHDDHELSAVDDRPRHDPQARGARRDRRAERTGGFADHVPRLPRARVELEPVALGPLERLSEPLRGLQPYPPVQASGVHRSSRLHADPVPPGRLPAARLRCPAALEGRHPRGSAEAGAARGLILPESEGDAMNLYAKLKERGAQGKPLRVGLIGAGKFGAMYLAQVPKTPGIHLAGIADLAPANARTNLERVGWNAEAYGARSLDAAVKQGSTHVGADWQALVAHPAIDIIVEATGHPIAAVSHALAAFKHGKHVVMVTV